MWLKCSGRIATLCTARCFSLLSAAAFMGSPVLEYFSGDPMTRNGNMGMHTPNWEKLENKSSKARKQENKNYLWSPPS